MGYDNGIHVSEAECIELTNLAIERAENSNGNIIDHLKPILHLHPESWYHAALELGAQGRPYDAIDCWQEYADQCKTFNVNKNENFIQNLIYGAECIQDLGLHFQFLDQDYINNISLKLIQQANNQDLTECGFQHEIKIINKYNPHPCKILKKIEDFLTSSGQNGVEINIFGILQNIHLSGNTEYFTLQTVLDDYIEIGCFSEAFELWSKIKKGNDPSDLIIKLLWYCINNGIEIEKSINESNIFSDDEEIENIEELKLQKQEAENKLKEKTQQLEEIQKQLEALKGYISNLMNFTK